MKQSSNEIGSIMDVALQQYSASMSFEAVWEEHLKSGKKPVRHGKVLKVPVAALITCILLFSVAFAGYAFFRNIDNTDYPFVDDPQVIGKWQSVDFVDKIENFGLDKKSFGEDLYLTELAFIKDGSMLYAFEDGNLVSTTSNWTKGLILNKQEKTAEKYTIKEIEGAAYMFMEWKSGDYVFRNMKPKYYVLKQIDSKDYSNHKDVVVREDKIDYPFVDNPEMIGKWESVDFVKSIDSFKAGESSWMGGVYLTGFDIRSNGELTLTTTAGSHSGSFLTWTKDLIISKNYRTASRCVIKEIDGETYMFFEWKSGDYTLRGMDPWYYVLKKVK